MEYYMYYSGTESLWCGNWNHLVCRRWKCEVDHPSQSTVVNLGKKQKCCSLWCPWSQVQQDTSGPHNFRILGCLWTIHHRCTCKWDWTEMLTVSFPLRAIASYEYRKCRREEGTIRTHWNVDCLLEDLSGKNPRKCCQLETLASWWCHLQSTCVKNQSASSCPNTKYLYLRLPFLKMKAFRIILVSL